jgi:hypothetical protein
MAHIDRTLAPAANKSPSTTGDGSAPRERAVPRRLRDRAVRTARRAEDDGAHASAPTVFWIVDYGSSHAGRASIEGRRRNPRLTHLPIHASWLNQMEPYFSIARRKALTLNDFASLAELEQRLLAFGRRHRAIAEPFAWSLTRQVLDRVLRAIDTHEPPLALAA